MLLNAHFTLALTSAPWLYHLTSQHIVTRRPVLQKVRHHTRVGALSACKHTVSGSISLPSRGSFHRSLTVLYSIGHMVVFSLTRWSSLIPTGFLVSRRTLDTPSLWTVSSTGLLPSLALFPVVFDYRSLWIMESATPRILLLMVWALPISLATTFGIVVLLSFPPGN